MLIGWECLCFMLNCCSCTCYTCYIHTAKKTYALYILPVNHQSVLCNLVNAVSGDVDSLMNIQPDLILCTSHPCNLVNAVGIPCHPSLSVSVVLGGRSCGVLSLVRRVSSSIFPHDECTMQSLMRSGNLHTLPLVLKPIPP